VTSPTSEREERPGIIDAVPVRHPGRYVAIAVLAVLGRPAQTLRTADRTPG